MDLTKFLSETDFESAAQSNEKKIEEANAEAAELESRSDNNDCTSGGCTI